MLPFSKIGSSLSVLKQISRIPYTSSTAFYSSFLAAKNPNGHSITHIRCNCPRCISQTIREAGTIRLIHGSVKIYSSTKENSTIKAKQQYQRPPAVDPEVRAFELESYRKWIQSELLAAMRSKNQPRMRSLKAIMAEIILTQKDPKSKIGLANIFKRSIRKREDANNIFVREGRSDLAAKEVEELDIIRSLQEESTSVLEKIKSSN